MAKFVCSDCGYGAGSWYGRCPSCGQWNTLKKLQEGEKEGKRGEEKTKKVEFTSLAKVASLKGERLKTGVFEFDRVLGGGLVGGEVVLLSGDPGVGKSTLLLKTLSKLETLYVSGEESGEQVHHRARRLDVNLNKLYFTDQVQIEGILRSAKKKINEIDVLVIDSIQTVYSKGIPSTIGSISQIKETSSKLASFAKKNGVVLVLVGHITKGGEIAGPKRLEHLVDCVLYLEGEKTSNFRVLRSSKNRYGPTDEVGIFEMREEGLKQVDKPTAFLDLEKKKASGRAVIGVVEGTRPLFFEVQSLVVPSKLASPRRVVSGLPFNKVLLISAVLRKHLNLPLDRFDLHVSVAGGVSVKSTAADLGVVSSIISSFKNKPVPEKSVFVGEVGLLGEVRRVFYQQKIVKESKRFGFKKIYYSKNTDSIKKLNRLFSIK